jgi:hypothetical protein
MYVCIGCNTKFCKKIHLTYTKEVRTQRILRQESSSVDTFDGMYLIFPSISDVLHYN